MDSLIYELQIVFYFQLFLSANVRHTFDRLNWQHSGEFGQNVSKSQMPRGLPGGGMGGFGIDWYITLRSRRRYAKNFSNKMELHMA